MVIMLQLLLAYFFAAGMGVTVFYLAKQNRKQGWRRPAARWFGIELETREAAAPSMRGFESEPDELFPELLRLNRELSVHGTPVKPQIELPAAESPESVEHVAMRRV